MGFTCQYSVELARSRTCASLHDKGKIRELVGRYGCPHASLVYGFHSWATETPRYAVIFSCCMLADHAGLPMAIRLCLIFGR